MSELKTIVDEVLDFSKKGFKELIEKDGARIKEILNDSKNTLEELAKAFKSNEIDEDDLKNEIESETNSVKARMLALEVENKVELVKFVNDLKNIVVNTIKGLV